MDKIIRVGVIKIGATVYKVINFPVIFQDNKVFRIKDFEYETLGSEFWFRM